MKVWPLVQNAGERRGWRRGHWRHVDLAQQQPQRIQSRAPGIFAFFGEVAVSPVIRKGSRLVSDERRRQRSSRCSATRAGESGIPASTAEEPVSSKALELQRRQRPVTSPGQGRQLQRGQRRQRKQVCVGKLRCGRIIQEVDQTRLDSSHGESSAVVVDLEH